MTDMITLPGVDPNMIANNLTPFEPTHPGELLADELESRNISPEKFAEQIEVKSADLKKIMEGKQSVDAEMAMMLEAALGIKAYLWLDLQRAFDLQTAASNNSFKDKLAKIRRIAAVL